MTGSHRSSQALTLRPFKLEYDSFGRLRLETYDGQTFSPVVPLRAFPMSDPDRWISLCGSHGEEIVQIADLAELAAELREIIKRDLAQRQFVPVIERIISTEHGEPSEWVVMTDRGRTAFQLNSEAEVRRIEPDAASIVDLHGVRYYIPRIKALDMASQRMLEQFL
jgi:hypothetical protein